MKTYKFQVTADWIIENLIGNDDVNLGTNEILARLTEKSDPATEWYCALQCIFGKPSKNFDGYIQKLEFDNQRLNIWCYLVENEAHYLLKARYPESWENEQTKAIERALRRHAECFSYWKNDNKVAWLSFKDIHVKQI